MNDKFGNVEKDDKGGYVAKEENTSIYDNARIYGDAQGSGDTHVSDQLEEARMNFKEMKEEINRMQKDYPNFVKAILANEYEMDDEEILEQVYEEFMMNDDMQLVNASFPELIEEMTKERKRMNEKMSEVYKTIDDDIER